MAKDTSGSVSFRVFSWFTTTLIGLFIVIVGGAWAMHTLQPHAGAAKAADLVRVERAATDGVAKLDVKLDDLGEKLTIYTQSMTRAINDVDKRLAIQESRQ